MGGVTPTGAPWAGGAHYEAYVGRWSRLVARPFLAGLSVPRGSTWLDVGCGTGALTGEVLAACAPAAVVGVDPSADFLASAAAQVRDGRASFRQGTAQALPVADGSVDAVVSGLVLNFVSDRRLALAEMRRAARSGGVVAAYVWDYAGEMQLMRYFWDAATDLDPAAADLDEGRRFPDCAPGPLHDLFAAAGLEDVTVEETVVPTVFPDFDDYWTPFLGGTGPAPAYAVSLADEHRAALREALRSRLPVGDDGSISLTARAWAVRGRCP
ncbi:MULTISPECIES: class I SAM-dependent methyltransferase [unclassified Geodermatophilus]|uniref:class I SAM-dependent methyltransferase n=1 Tax=unclassified Geodermatophilus TaxID=2637632 RepID=UPI003EEC804A